MTRGSVHDITEHRFEQLFDVSPVAMALCRLADRHVIAANAALRAGWPASVVGKPLVALGEEAAGAAIWARLDAGDEVDHELELGTARGLRTFVVTGRRLTLEDPAHALISLNDVTDHRQADTRAALTEQWFGELADNIQEVFWLWDVESATHHYVSSAYERIFDRSRTALDAHSDDWLAAVHPDDRDHMRRVGRAVSDAPEIDRYRIIRRDGATRTISDQRVPVRDAHGVVVRIAGIAEDITDRLDLEEQVRQTQKLESLGLLAGGVAHDFNNILAVIAANAGMLGEATEEGTEPREIVDEIEAAVARATGLTRQLLAFSRKQLVDPVVLDLNIAVKDTQRMLRRMVGEDVVITTSLEPDLASVRIDPGHLVQVLMNLAVNARDAMPGGGTLTLTTRAVADTSADEVLLEVHDSGHGMTDEVRARVFEPLFTTKGIGKGTGLGLSVVAGIIDQAGGRLELDTVVGRGSTFRIYLPAIHEPPVAPISSHHHAPGGNELVLLVDDDPFVRSATARGLRSRGYEVVEAGSGDQALRILREQIVHIALMITDVVMPNMNGAELARTARGRHPELRVLFTSGYTDDALLDHGITTRNVDFLEKPFGVDVLAARVRRLIDEPVKGQSRRPRETMI